MLFRSAMLERQTGFKFKRLRTDGGAEYDNALMRAWCASSGVIHELTSRDSPQQDGPGERLNRTVWDRVRPVMKESVLGNTGREQWRKSIYSATTLNG